MAEETFEFTAKTKKNLFIFIAVGAVLALLGIFSISMGGGHHELEGEAGHAFHWTQRLYANLWINNVYFAGIALIGVLVLCHSICSPGGMVCWD